MTTLRLMRPRLIALLMFVSLAVGLHGAFAVSPSVSNVIASQRTDGSYIVDISYDVSDSDSDNLWVGVSVSKNGGSYFAMTPSTLTVKGDVGKGISPGTNKSIEWYADKDLPDVNASNFQVRITASDEPSVLSESDTTFGTYVYFRQHSGMPSFLDNSILYEIDPRNYASGKMYQQIGPDGEGVVMDNDWYDLFQKEPDNASREWWWHCLRQMVDARLDFMAMSSFGQTTGAYRECAACTVDEDPECLYDPVFSPFQPQFQGRALGRILDETGAPLNVVFFLDTPGAWNRYNWDRMSDYYGEGEWCEWLWAGNGEDDDDIIQPMPVTVRNVERYFYEYAIKPFYANFNRQQDRAHWQTHNDKPLSEGGRPIIYFYGGPTVWFSGHQNSAAAFQRIKDRFEDDFGVEPFFALDSSWFDLVSGQDLLDLEAVADCRQEYLGSWIWGETDPPDPNTWVFNNYRVTRISPGIHAPEGHWGGRFDDILSKRWIYVDDEVGSDEDYFLDREWAMGSVGSADHVIIGHWDEMIEGEQICLATDYLKKTTGTLTDADHYLNSVRAKIEAMDATPVGYDNGESSNFTVNNTNATGSPQAEFTCSPAFGVAPLIVSFADLSGAEPTSWAWDFDVAGGPSTDSTDQNPFCEYSVAGTYTVKLTATNSSGSDSETKTAYIKVYAAQSDTWTASQDFSSSQGDNNWYYLEWDGYEYAPISYQSGYWEGSHTWTRIYAGTQHPDVNEPVRAWRCPHSGEVSITGTVKKGDPNGGDGVYASIYQNTSLIWGPQFIEYDDTTGYSTNVNVDAYEGDFFYFHVSQNSTSSNDMTSWDPTIALTWHDMPSPTADFTVNTDDGDAPLSVTFTDTTTNDPVMWEWDFDNDGVVDSTLQNPTYTYAVAGPYTVTLTVSNAHGTDSETKSEYITVGDEYIDEYQASTDFSSTQGADHWYYFESDGSTYFDFLEWNSSLSLYDGTYDWTRITSDAQHPDVYTSVRAWQSPKTGTVNITGTVKKGDTSCGDGVIVGISLNNSTWWWGPQFIDYDDSTGFTIDITKDINIGDLVLFHVHQNSNNYCDSTAWDPAIELTYWE